MLKNPFLPAAAWLVCITILSVAPGLPSFDWNLISFDKAAHAGVYGLFTVLLCRGFFKKNGRFSWKNGLFCFLFAASWGMLMEWVQGTFFPYRFFEWPDELANSIGAALGWAAFSVWVWRRSSLNP